MRNMYLKMLLSIVIGCIPVLLHAQSQTVSGVVSSAEDGQTIPGVTVSVKGTTTGQITDVEGKYRINVPAGENTLIFSYVGFVTQEVPVGNKSEIDVQLEADIKTLGEVVVVGYGEQNRKTLTSAISQVNSKEIKDIPTPSPDQLLQGRAPGVTVSAGSGEPGAGVFVRVRGSTSINASSEPLYVIDGVPIVSQNLARSTFGQPSNPLADINPADIESMEILKDASATAIYGARAANGVILITTKRGKSGKAKVSINAYAGISTPSKDPNELRVDGPTFEKLQNEAATNNWIDSYGSIDTAAPDGTIFTLPYTDPDNAIDTNWLDAIFQNGSIYNIDASVSGGNERIKYLVSGNNFSQEGLIKPTKFSRRSARINLDFFATDKIKIGTSLFYSNNERNRLQNGNSINGALTTAFFYPSNEPIYNEDGSYNRPIWESPVAVANETDYSMVTDRIIGNVFADWEIIEGLIFKTSWSIDNNYITEDQYYNTKLNAGAAVNGSATNSVVQDLNWINENVLTYQFNLGGDHNFNLLLGTTVQKNTNRYVSATGEQFPGDSFKKITSAAVKTSDSDETFWGIASVFGRINYDFKQKYLLTANMRYDGSSRFGANKRWGFFPSASVGWVLSEEEFLQDVQSISEMKLRVSYGVTGNQSGIGNFASMALWGGQMGNLNGGGGTSPTGPAAYGNLAGFNPISMANPDLKWETTSQFDIGFNLGLFEDRLTFSFDYYNKQTKDLLLDVPVPRSTGYTTLTQNYGQMENKGFEIAVGAVPVSTSNFSWNMNFNIAQNKNLVKKLSSPFTTFTRDYIRVEEGYPLFSFWVHEQLGVDPQTGDVIWNTGDDDVFDPNVDRFIIGKNAWPDFQGGFTNNLRFKNFDLMAFFQFSVGNDILNYNRFFYEHGGERTTGYSAQQLDRWQQPGDITDIPRMARVNYNTAYRPSRQIEDGSYLRVKNLTLGYTIPRDISEKIGMSQFRIYASGQNVLTFTKYTGLDPEVSVDPGELVQGADLGVMPQPRIWMGGVNITF